MGGSRPSEGNAMRRTGKKRGKGSESLGRIAPSGQRNTRRPAARRRSRTALVVNLSRATRSYGYKSGKGEEGARSREGEGEGGGVTRKKGKRYRQGRSGERGSEILLALAGPRANSKRRRRGGGGEEGRTELTSRDQTRARRIEKRRGIVYDDRDRPTNRPAVRDRYGSPLRTRAFAGVNARAEDDAEMPERALDE